MANKRIKDLATVATEADLVAGNYLAIDGSAGTKKLPAESVAKRSVQNNSVKSIALPFDSSKGYGVGDYVTKDGLQYIFTQEHTAGDQWIGEDSGTGTNVEEVSCGGTIFDVPTNLDLNDPQNWESGAINHSDGSITVDATSLRTKLFKFTEKTWIHWTLASGVSFSNFLMYAYDKEQKYLGYWRTNKIADMLARWPSSVYYRFSFITLSGTTISPDNIVNIATMAGARIYSDGLEARTATLEKNSELGVLYSQGIKFSDFNDQNKTEQENFQDFLDFCDTLTNKVMIIDKNITISKAILLKSNTTVIIDGSIIKQGDLMFDNVFRSYNEGLKDDDLAYLPTSMERQENISIIGINGAMIIGPDVNAKIYHTPTSTTMYAFGDWFGVRTHQIDMACCDNVKISGITFLKTRGWCISFCYCQNVEVSSVSITSTVKNGDGIDFRVGCKHCKVKNLFAKTSDDAVAMTALGNLNPSFPDGNYMYSSESTSLMNASFVAEDPNSINIEDMLVEHVEWCGYVGGDGHGIICLSAYGSKVQNVLIRDFIEKNSRVTKEALVKVYTGYGSGFNPGDLQYIRISNVQTDKTTYAFMSNCVLRYTWINGARYKNNLEDLRFVTGITFTNCVSIA